MRSAFDKLDDNTFLLILRKLEDAHLANMKQTHDRANTLTETSSFWKQRLLDEGFPLQAITGTYFSESTNAYKKLYKHYKKKKHLISIEMMEIYEPVFMSGDTTTFNNFLKTDVDLRKFKEEDLLLLACFADDLEFNLILLKKIIGEKEFDTKLSYEKILLAAFRQGNVTLAKEIIKLAENKQIPIEKQALVDNDGANLLLHAFRSGLIDCVQEALNLGIDPQLKDDAGRTLVHFAVESEKLAMLEQALAITKNVLVDDHYGNSPLSNAIFLKLHEMIDRLLLCKIDKKSISSSSKNFLHEAFASGDITIIKKIEAFDIDAKALTTDGHSILYFAVTSGSIPAVELAEIMLNKKLHKIAKSEKEASCLHKAARNGHLAMIKHCVKEGFDINARDESGSTVLLNAFQNEYAYLMIDELIKLGADPALANDAGLTILHYATETAHPLLIKKALELIKDVNVKNAAGQNALFYTNTAQALQLLLKHKIDVNAADSKNITPLMLMATTSSLDCCKLLLAQPTINKSATNQHGYDALDVAIFSSECEFAILDLLVKKDFQLNNKNINNVPLAILAALNCSLTRIKELIQLGMDIHCKDHQGRNALHYIAAHNDAKKMEELLTAFDLDPKEKDANEYSAYDRARPEVKAIIDTYLEAKANRPRLG